MTARGEQQSLAKNILAQAPPAAISGLMDIFKTSADRPPVHTGGEQDGKTAEDVAPMKRLPVPSLSNEIVRRIGLPPIMGSSGPRLYY